MFVVLNTIKKNWTVNLLKKKKSEKCSLKKKFGKFLAFLAGYTRIPLKNYTLNYIH